MIIRRYHDGSEGFFFETGDRVVVSRTIGGGWFDYGPVNAERCTIRRIEPFRRGAEPNGYTDELFIHYSDDWGPAHCFPWMIAPHADTYAAAVTAGRFEDVPCAVAASTGEQC